VYTDTGWDHHSLVTSQEQPTDWRPRPHVWWVSQIQQLVSVVTTDKVKAVESIFELTHLKCVFGAVCIKHEYCTLFSIHCFSHR